MEFRPHGGGVVSLGRVRPKCLALGGVLVVTSQRKVTMFISPYTGANLLHSPNFGLVRQGGDHTH